MQTQNLSKSWHLSYPSYFGEFGGATVDLPHDWAIAQPRSPKAASGASGGFYPGAELCYERTLDVPPAGLAVLEFEGVYCNAEVRLNGHLVQCQHYGYTGFLVDLSAIAKRDEPNRLKVNVYANARPDCRWYTGAGIYRPVLLHTAPADCAVHPWGLTAETLALTDNTATLRIRAGLLGRRAGCKLAFSVLDPGGACVYQGEQDAADTGDTLHTFTLDNPRPWSAETPALYTLRCQVLQSGAVADTAEAPFGIRTIVLSAAQGLLINGKTVKLRGGCVHADNGLLGAAAFDRAEERKAELMKANGFNAVRCAHNPPAPAFLRACDRLGLYVMDEAFDMWQEGKNPYDYHQFFESDWQKDIDSMVLRDRRHPCVILWSTGNEIPERDGRLSGYAVAKKLFDRVKALDETRPVTNCLCNVSTLTELTGLEANIIKEDPDYDLWAARTTRFTDFLDVVGYNYLLYRYEADGDKFPGRIICGTESFPLEAYDIWQAADKLPYVIGDFVWTSIDYLGEAGIGHVWRGGEHGFLRPYPWHFANCGDIDICGQKRPQSYYRDAVWGIDKAPCIAVIPPQKTANPGEISRWGWPETELFWNFPGDEGKPAAIEVYSSCAEIELWLNGQSLGRMPTDKCKAVFTARYAPGVLRAAGYQNGAAVCESELRTAGTPDHLRFCSDRDKLPEDGDIAYITIEAVDAGGTVAATEDAGVCVQVAGGRLLALGVANPESEESYAGPGRRLYHGRLTAVVQGFGTGPVRVTAKHPTLADTVLEL